MLGTADGVVLDVLVVVDAGFLLQSSKGGWESIPGIQFEFIDGRYHSS